MTWQTKITKPISLGATLMRMHGHQNHTLLVLTLLTIGWFSASENCLGANELPAVETRDGIKPRNVVFILTDDHRYDAMEFMGHPFLKTPHLNSLASNGVHLKNAFVTTSLCSPSRASILTGNDLLSAVPQGKQLLNRLHWKMAHGRGS
jgi:hypothetical protein